MSLWNKILVWLIGVASLPLLFLAMWTLKTHKYWAELADRYEQRINGKDGVGGLNDEIQKLAEGVYKDGELVTARHSPSQLGTLQAAVGSPPGVVQLRSERSRWDARRAPPRSP